MCEEEIKPSTCVCCRHFPEGDTSKVPSLTLGKRFASPMKKGPRAKRAKVRDEDRQLREGSISCVSEYSGRSVTPMSPPPDVPQLHTVVVGEQLESDYSIHELLGCSTRSNDHKCNEKSLLARIEMLQAENASLKKKMNDKSHFRVEDIQHDDKLICFYTGFISYFVFVTFFEFLGPAVNNLRHWGSKGGVRLRQRARKLDPKNQIFLTLVKLKLNLKLSDLAFRFGLSPTQVSRYLTTWICFLYHHLKEIYWMPSVQQVRGTLPTEFKENFPSTFAIIDGSEVFIETPTDLHMQSSTWSAYKHHNTVKFLVACTPNGAISYISAVYVGSISDMELTCVSGFLSTLEGKQGISIMADRGFMIKDMLKELHIELNVPPFLEQRQQFPSGEVEIGRRIASLRIHVERAIGRMKNYSILKQTIPISLARLTNQIIFVCAFLTNFQRPLVPLSKDSSEGEVDSYFEQLSDCDSDSDTDDNADT